MDIQEVTKEEVYSSEQEEKNFAEALEILVELMIEKWKPLES